MKTIAAQTEGGNVTVYLRLNGTSGAGTLLTSFAVAGTPGTLINTWLVLHPGDVVHAYATGANCDLSLHGTELEGVAD